MVTRKVNKTSSPILAFVLMNVLRRKVDYVVKQPRLTVLDFIVYSHVWVFAD